MVKNFISISFLPALWVLLVSVFFSGCYFAPGMHFGETESADDAVDTLADFHGAKVHLQSITPATLTANLDTMTVTYEIPDVLLKRSEEPYRLGKFDVIQISIWENQELPLPLASYKGNNTVEEMLDENGEIFFPYVGAFKAEGMSLTEVRAKIEEGVSAVLKAPKIEVHLAKSQSQKAFLQGGGAHAGVIPLSNIPVTLLEALNNNGAAQTDDTTEVVFVRDGVNYTINMRAPYPLGKGPADIVLRNGDIIRVSGKELSKIFVLGEVNHQTAIPVVDGDMTLAQALAEVGGIQTMSAQSRGIYVIRGDLKEINVYHLNARNPMALVFGDQFKLKPHDIVFVDATGVARWNRVMSQILPTVQTFYYGVHSASVVKDDLTNW